MDEKTDPLGIGDAAERLRDAFAGAEEAAEDEGKEEVRYRIGGLEVTRYQLWAYRELEAAFMGSAENYMLAKTDILFGNLDKDDIKLRKMRARQVVAITIVMDDGATDHISKTVHYYTGGRVGIATEHADPHMTPVMTGPLVQKVDDEAKADGS